MEKQEMVPEIEEQLEKTQEHAEKYLSGSRRWTEITLYTGGKHYSISVTNNGEDDSGDEHFVYETFDGGRYRYVGWEKDVECIDEDELE